MEKITKDKKKYLVENLKLMTIAAFVPKGILFFMLPVYTRFLTTSEYGIAELITNTVSILVTIFSLQIQDAVLWWAITHEREKKETLSIGLRITLVGGFILIAILLIACTIFPDYALYSIYIVVNYYAYSLKNIFSYFCRGIDKVKTITLSSVIDILCSVGLSLLLLIGFHMGLVGYLIACSTGVLAGTLFMYFNAGLAGFIHISFENDIMKKEMIRFSIPMIFSAISFWINNASDKYILSLYCGTSIVGIYAASSKIPSILNVFGDVIAKAFSISTIKEFDKDDKDGFLGETYESISLFLVIITSAIMICNIYISRILYSKAFYNAWMYVPPLLVSVFANRLSESCSNVLLGAGKTKAISVGAVLGAIINTILNFILIPIYGAYGAAVATIIGFIITWRLRYFYAKREVCMKHNIMLESTTYFIIVLQMILAYWGNKYIHFQIICFIVIVFVYKDKIYEKVSFFFTKKTNP